MSEPLPGWHYDGRSGVRHAVEVSLEPGRIVLSPMGEAVPIDDLIAAGDRHIPTWGRKGNEGWRLGFDGPLPPDWAAALPGQEHHGGVIDRWGILPSLLVGALLAVGGAMLLWQSAILAARLIPERWEVAFGTLLLGDFGSNACAGKAGQAALDRLAGRLATDGRPVHVRVIDLDMVNAAALPGRNVAIFSGLIDGAKSADEVAGVLGHEIGHVEHRDVLASLIRDFGLSLILGGADGGAIAQGLVTSRYSRAAERGADSAAIAGLARANISPAPTAAFFDRLGKMETSLPGAGIMLGYLASHPLSDDRRRLFADSAVKGRAYAPAMSAGEWAAVQGICKASK